MKDFEYWKECISLACEECGLGITENQLNCIVESVSGGHENYSMAFGYDAISSRNTFESQGELTRLKKELEEKRLWEIKTLPCKRCTTSGTIQDGWGRDIVCDCCNGKGRI